jgi:hypothetical protein
MGKHIHVLLSVGLSVTRGRAGRSFADAAGGRCVGGFSFVRGLVWFWFEWHLGVSGSGGVHVVAMWLRRPKVGSGVWR